MEIVSFMITSLLIENLKLRGCKIKKSMLIRNLVIKMQYYKNNNGLDQYFCNKYNFINLKDN